MAKGPNIAVNARRQRSVETHAERRRQVKKTPNNELPKETP